MAPLTPDTILLPTPDLVGEVLDGEFAALDPETGSVLLFNDTATQVFELLDGHRDVREVVEQLSEAYDTPSEQLADEVMALLDQLVATGVVTQRPPTE